MLSNPSNFGAANRDSVTTMTGSTATGGQSILRMGGNRTRNAPRGPPVNRGRGGRNARGRGRGRDTDPGRGNASARSDREYLSLGYTGVSTGRPAFRNPYASNQSDGQHGSRPNRPNRSSASQQVGNLRNRASANGQRPVGRSQ